MNLYRARETPRYPGERVFRYSWVGPALLTLFCSGGACVLAGFGWAILSEGIGFIWLALVIVGICLAGCLLGMAVGWSQVRACFRDSNWLVKFSPSGFLVQFRSHLNHHFSDDDPTVVLIYASEVAFVRRTRVKREVPNDKGGTATEYLNYLDIHLKHQDTASLKAALDDERRRVSPENRRKIKEVLRQRRLGTGSPKRLGSRMVALHFPVRLLEPQVVRVDWRGIRPRLNRALRAFAQAVPVQDPSRTDQGKLRGLSEKEIDDLILDLCESGETIKAVELIKRRHGWDTSRAKQFADELMSGRKK